MDRELYEQDINYQQELNKVLIDLPRASSINNIVNDNIYQRDKSQREEQEKIEITLRQNIKDNVLSALHQIAFVLNAMKEKRDFYEYKCNIILNYRTCGYESFLNYVHSSPEAVLSRNGCTEVKKIAEILQQELSERDYEVVFTGYDGYYSESKMLYYTVEILF